MDIPCVGLISFSGAGKGVCGNIPAKSCFMLQTRVKLEDSLRYDAVVASVVPGVVVYFYLLFHLSFTFMRGLGGWDKIKIWTDSD